MTKQTRLLASCAGTIEEAEKMLNGYFYSKGWKVIGIAGGWQGFNPSSGKTLGDIGARLELKRGRFRLVTFARP